MVGLFERNTLSSLLIGAYTLVFIIPFGAFRKFELAGVQVNINWLLAAYVYMALLLLLISRRGLALINSLFSVGTSYSRGGFVIFLIACVILVGLVLSQLALRSRYEELADG